MSMDTIVNWMNNLNVMDLIIFVISLLMLYWGMGKLSKLSTLNGWHDVSSSKINVCEKEKYKNGKIGVD